MNTLQNYSSKNLIKSLFGFSLFIILLTLPMALFAQTAKDKRIQLKDSIRDLQHNVLVQSLLDNKGNRGLYMNLIHFPDPKNPCLLEIVAMVPHGLEIDYTRKMRTIRLDHLKSFPSIQPQSKPGLYNNGIIIGDNLFYLSERYPNQKRDNLIKSFQHLTVLCRKLAFLDNTKTLENKLATLSSKISSTVRDPDDHFCNVKRQERFNDVVKQLKSQLEDVDDLNFQNVEILNGESFFEIPL